MKKIITLFIIVFLWARVSAQDNATYEMEVTVSIYDVANNHSASCDNRFDLHASLSDGSELFWSKDVGEVNTTPITYSKIFTLTKDQYLDSFYFYGTRNWRNAFSCNGAGGYGTTIEPSYFACSPPVTYNDIIPYWGSTVTVRVTPKTYNLFYFGTGSSNQTNSSTWYLPETPRVTLKATQGYSSPVYGWQYQIGNGAWANLPSALYPGFGHTLTFSGSDISSDYINSIVLANQTVRVRSVSWLCEVASTTMQLIPVLNTPTIVNAEPTAQSCAAINDGKIKITLNRALYTGETVSIRVNGVIAVPNLTKDNFVDKSYTMTNLTPGTRTLSVQGAYNGQPTFANSNTLAATVAPAPVITYSLSYNGTDNIVESNSSLWYLPAQPRVIIKTTSGYSSNQYNWQYQIGNGSWVAFNPNLSTAHTLTFSGNDISSDYVNTIVVPNQTVRVRLMSSCGQVSDAMQLLPVLTTPSILTAVPTAQSCGGVNDGKIKITLNRALYTGETLAILIDGTTVVQNLTKANFVSNSYTVTNRPPGSYIVSVQGVYNGRPTFWYSNTGPVTVAAAPPFTFTTTSSDIHCPGGQDGIINIAVQGGKAPYVAFLDLSNGDTQTMVLLTSVSSVTDLAAETYTVRLVDSKACSPRDAIGDVVDRTVVITEPTTPPVTVSLVDVTPSGPGQSNGSIIVRATGASGIYSFLWIEINTGAIFTAEPPLISGDGMTNRLSGIGGGQYQVVVRDSQYALVNPQTESNTAGCQGVWEQTVVETSARVSASNVLADKEADAYIQQFFVSPNPTNSRFAASVSLRDAGDFTLTLLNSQGIVVSQQKYTAESTVTADFEVAATKARGIYLLRLTTAEQSSAVRVLIE